MAVRSTLDWGLQQQADRAVLAAIDAAGAARPRRRAGGDRPALRRDPGLHERQPERRDRPHDHARSPGTASRVFTYAAAIAGRQHTMVTPVDDAPVAIDLGEGAPYRPRNFDLAYHARASSRPASATG